MAGHWRTAVCRLCLALTAQTLVCFLPKLRLHCCFVSTFSVVSYCNVLEISEGLFSVCKVNSASSSLCFIILFVLFHDFCKSEVIREKRLNCIQE